jgi:hypothetical protein
MEIAPLVNLSDSKRSILAFELSPDGARFATIDDCIVHIWHLAVNSAPDNNVFRARSGWSA